MVFDDFTSQLKEGVAPVYAIKGEDRYWLHKAYQSIVSLADEMDVSVFSPLEGLSAALTAAENFPFLGEYRVVVLRELTFTEGEKKAIEAYVANPVPTTVLLFYSCQWAPKEAKNYVFNRLRPAECVSAAGALAKEMDLKYDTAALRLLVNYCDQDMGCIEGELVKLGSYCGKETVDEAAVRAIVTPSANFQVYAFTDQVSRGSYVGAYRVVNSLLSTQVDYPTFLGLLINHYRMAFYSRISGETDAEVARALGNKKAFAAAKAASCAEQYSPRALLGLLRTMYRLEFEFKSGKTTAEQALELAITEAIERRNA